MIRVSIQLDEDGCLRRLNAEGHSFRKGRDYSPACAAVSALIRTAAELCEAAGRVPARISLPEEGRISIEIDGTPPKDRGRNQGIADFLVCGLLRIEKEAPGELELTVTE